MNGVQATVHFVVCSFCGYFIVFVCLSLRCWGLDVDLIVSVLEFSCLRSLVLFQLQQIEAW